MRAGCISIRAAAAISNACCATATFPPPFSPAPSGSETRLVERGITKYNLAARARPDRRHAAGSSLHPGAGPGRGRSVDPFRGRRGAHQSRPAGAGARRKPRCVHPLQAAPRRRRRTPDRRGARTPRRGASPIVVVSNGSTDRLLAVSRRNAHDDLARRVRGAAARAPRRRLRPAVLRRLGADDGLACRSIAAGG